MDKVYGGARFAQAALANEEVLQEVNMVVDNAHPRVSVMAQRE